MGFGEHSSTKNWNGFDLTTPNAQLHNNRSNNERRDLRVEKRRFRAPYPYSDPPEVPLTQILLEDLKGTPDLPMLGAEEVEELLSEIDDRVRVGHHPQQQEKCQSLLAQAINLSTLTTVDFNLDLLPDQESPSATPSSSAALLLQICNQSLNVNDGNNDIPQCLIPPGQVFMALQSSKNAKIKKKVSRRSIPLSKALPDIVVKGIQISPEIWAKAYMKGGQETEGQLTKCTNVFFDHMFDNDEIIKGTLSGRNDTEKLDPRKLEAIETAVTWIRNNRKDGLHPYRYSEQNVGKLRKGEPEVIHKVFVDRRNERRRGPRRRKSDNTEEYHSPTSSRSPRHETEEFKRLCGVLLPSESSECYPE